MTKIDGAVQWLRDQVSPGDSILCATSGGLDSMCLAHLLHQLGYPVTIAHYHHGLRGAAADGDAQFVKTWCEEKALPFVMEQGDVAAYGKTQGLGLEEAGRKLRYDFLYRSAKTHGCKWIATAHHGDDNVETMLLNLCRGTGLAGLCGIPAVSGQVIRPLLCLCREELEAYAQEQGIGFVQDQTNGDLYFSRNRLRHQVLPELTHINPQMVAHFTQTAQQLRAENAYLTAQSQAIPRAVSPTNITFGWADLDAHAPLAPRAVHQAIAQLVGHSRDITALHIDSILSLPRRRAQVSLPYGLVVRSTTDILIVEKIVDLSASTPLCVDKSVLFGAWQVDLSTKSQSNASHLVHLADTALTVTTWQSQDRMGSRSLKRCFVDGAISPVLRDTLPTVRNANGVVAVAKVGIHPDFVCSGEKTSQFYITFTYKGDEYNG